MKSRIVKFLCRMGFYKLAYKISPKLAAYYKYQIFKELGAEIKKGFEKGIAAETTIHYKLKISPHNYKDALAHIAYCHELIETRRKRHIK